MAKRKKPENETPEQTRERKMFELIANAANRSEKTSWNRKLDNMNALLKQLEPIEEQILALMEQKLPIFDQIQELRNIMVNECIHPFDFLVEKPDHILCKFCNKRLRKPDEFRTQN